jgi:hypothetical protein
MRVLWGRQRNLQLLRILKAGKKPEKRFSLLLLTWALPREIKNSTIKAMLNTMRIIVIIKLKCLNTNRIRYWLPQKIIQTITISYNSKPWIQWRRTYLILTINICKSPQHRLKTISPTIQWRLILSPKLFSHSSPFSRNSMSQIPVPPPPPTNQTSITVPPQLKVNWMCRALWTRSPQRESMILSISSTPSIPVTTMTNISATMSPLRLPVKPEGQITLIVTTMVNRINRWQNQLRQRIVIGV